MNFKVTKKNNKFIIQRKVLGFWFNTKTPEFVTYGDAQSYINLRLTK